MITTQTIDLSMTPEITVLPEVYCSQYDNGIRQVVFNLFEDADQTTPYNVDGLNAIVQGTKPDNNAYAVEAQASGSSVTVTITTQMAAVAGIAPSEIVLMARDTVQRIGSLNFLLMVEPAGILDDAVVSDSEIPIYVDLAVKEAAAQAEAWANGHREGVPVGPDDPAYHNNAKYWSAQTAGQTIDGLRDVSLPTETPDGSLLRYNATTEKWENIDSPISAIYGGTGNADGYIRAGNITAGTTIGQRSTVEGYRNSAAGDYAHAEGAEVKAYGLYSHAEGFRTKANVGSHAEGYDSDAAGMYAHAEGRNTKAAGSYSHAEGIDTTATADNSHAGGRGVEAKLFAEFMHGADDYTRDYMQKFYAEMPSGTNTGGFVFSFAPHHSRGMAYATPLNISENMEIDLIRGGGCAATISGTAAANIKLHPSGMYLLFCSSFTITTGAIFGATARMVSALPVDTGTPNILNLAQTTNAPATITAAANNVLTIQNAAAARATQFTLIRVA